MKFGDRLKQYREDVKIEMESKNVVALRKIIKKVSNEQKMEKEKREKAKQLAGYYKTHPFQGGGCSGK